MCFFIQQIAVGLYVHMPQATQILYYILGVKDTANTAVVL